MKTFSLLMSFAVLFACGTARAQEPAVRVQGYHIEGPTNSADFPKWIADLKSWRTEYLKRIGYDDAEYRRPELRWAQSSFMQPQMMVEDRYFYDPVVGRYPVNRYLDDLERRYGGIDSVLIWPVYPNIGIDNRNEFDCFRDLPGGIPGIKQMVADFHRRGVRVLFPYMPWDQGTRQEGREHYAVIAENLAVVGADGINGDTMPVVPRTFRTASDKTGHPLVFEPEGRSVDEGLTYNNMNWGQAAAGGGGGRGGRGGGNNVPPVAKFKWLEPRHMINISDRWQRDKNVDLQYAFFNGIGMETWENVWGIWNEMTLRDSAICRRIHKIDLKFADLLVSTDWEPHTPPPLQSGIYASRFPGKDQTLWTIINKNEFNVSGRQLRLPHQEGRKYYDLWHGVDVQYPWEDSPRRNHRHMLQIKRFHIDRYPVSNADFKKFVDAVNYRPKDDHNFLKDWKNGTYPAGWENKPVAWISLEDARAYAAWAGKRLPHEWEWQYAAQGTDGRTYPWGSAWDPQAVPVPEKGHDLPGPDNVDAHPKGASPFGVMDLTGNVWQWTDEYQDEHTRAAILRGGSYYQPQGSMWYFPQAYKLTEHGKLLLMAPGKDRAGTLGFRCVVDAQ